MNSRPSPLFTVAVPAYNRLDLLRRALDSAKAQTFSDFELIVSDNASTEDVVALVSSYSDPRFRVMRHPRGIGMARNWHASLSSGLAPWVAWLHDDDYWEPTHLAEAARHVEQWPGASLYTTGVRHFFSTQPAEIQLLQGHETLSEPVFFESGAAGRLWLRKHQAQCSCVVVRRSVLPQTDWGPEGLIRQLDYFIISQFATLGGWIYNPAVQVHYRAHDPGDIRRVEMSAAFRVQKAQAVYIRRRLAELAMSRGGWDEAALLRECRGWAPEQRIDLALSLGSRFSPAPLRKAARLLVREVTIDRGLRARHLHARLLAILGPGYLYWGESISRLRYRWTPAGTQISIP